MQTQIDDENIVNVLQKVNYLDIKFYHLVIIGDSFNDTIGKINDMLKLKSLLEMNLNLNVHYPLFNIDLLDKLILLDQTRKDAKFQIRITFVNNKNKL